MIKSDTLRKIQVVLLYIGCGTIIAVILIMLVTGTGIYDFRIKHPDFFKNYLEPVVAVIIFGTGIPFVILSFINGIPSNPAKYVSMENPFGTYVELSEHLMDKVEKTGYNDVKTITCDEGLSIQMYRRNEAIRTKIFGIIHAHKLTTDEWDSLEQELNSYIDPHLGKITRSVYLTLLICVENSSKDYYKLVRRYGQSPGLFYVHVGFNFERHTMSFISKIDGFAAGKRKKLLKDFLAMLPEPQRYAKLNKLGVK